jgi:hypothetical protein
LAGNKFYLLALALSLFLFAAACSAAGTGGTPTPYPAEVDWETAVEILNTGDVKVVMQAHNLDVYLTMKDSSEIKTVEPQIDAIFREIEACGRPCRDIVQVTE